MKSRATWVVLALAVMALASCAPKSKFRTYNGPPVTQIVIMKGQRQMYLMDGPTVLKSYEVGLGWAPVGQKHFEGDGRTPEGVYYIDRKNPNSSYHLSLGISYPTPAQIAAARAVGRSPGGDIMIHGGPPPGEPQDVRDWTWGCIAVRDKQIEQIYAMVQDGTPVYIYP